MFNKNNAKQLKVLLYFQLFLFNTSFFSQLPFPEPFVATHRNDGIVDVVQLADSFLIGVVSNAPYDYSPSFINSQDSVLNQVIAINLFTKEVKSIPLKGDADSLQLLMTAGSFVHNNEFYFSSRRMSRANFPAQFPSITDPIPAFSNRTIYKVVDDSLVRIADLTATVPVIDANAFCFRNISGNYINVIGAPGLSGYQIAEYDSTGQEIAISPIINDIILQGIIQNPLDSSYLLKFLFNRVHRLDKNLQVTSGFSLIKEENTGRNIDIGYFQSFISEKPFVSAIIKPLNIGDSVFVSSGYLLNDTTYAPNWKQFLFLEPVGQQPLNYVYNDFYGFDSYENNFFYAYNRATCFPGDPTCPSRIRVLKHDTLNNTLWNLQFGGDANYEISKIVALRDGGCVVFLRRYTSSENVDMYYVRIDANGQIQNGFLPLLGAPEIEIPIFQTFTLYPNPTIESLTFDNESLASIAKQIVLIDYQGKVVQEQPFQKTIDVSNLPAGAYIYRLEDQNGKWYDRKFLKR